MRETRIQTCSKPKVGRLEFPMQTYPTDLTSTELNLILPNLPILEPHPRRKWTYEILLNAIYYVLKGGIQWRMMPVNFPPWPTVYWYWRTWCQDGTWERLNTVLREKVRISEGRDPQPSAGVLDSQSAKTTEMGGERGYDGAKSVNGRKRFILVDTLGLHDESTRLPCERKRSGLSPSGAAVGPRS